jgi:hypothetical protein
VPEKRRNLPARKPLNDRRKAFPNAEYGYPAFTGVTPIFTDSTLKKWP